MKREEFKGCDRCFQFGQGFNCIDCWKIRMIDGKPTNPKDRDATDRIDLSLFPDSAVVYGALAMTEGDCKYGGYNYRPGGVQASTYIAACRRHLAKWWNGDNEDPHTRVPHLASALACIAVIIDAQESGVLQDNRPPKQSMEELINRVKENVRHLQKLYPNGPERYTELGVTYAHKTV